MELYITTYTNIHSKWFKNLIMRHETKGTKGPFDGDKRGE